MRTFCLLQFLVIFGILGWVYRQKIGRKRSPARSRVPRVQTLLHKRKRKEPQMRLFSFWQGQKDLNPRHAVLEAQYMVVIVCYNHNK